MTITNVVSLGCNCHTAMFAKMIGIRQFSCPFDWICIGFHDLLSILDDNFEKFIDPKYLIDHVDNNVWKCGHSIYSDRMFHHFNPRLPDHTAYYERCIQRFRNQNGTRLYIYQSFYEVIDHDRVQALENALSKYSDDFCLLVINYTVKSGLTESEIRIQEQDGRSMIAHAKIVDDINGVAFLHRPDAEALARFLFDTFHFNIDVENDTKDEKRLATDITL